MAMRRQPFYSHPMMNMLDWSPLSFGGMGMSPFDFIDPFEHLQRIMGRVPQRRQRGGLSGLGLGVQRPLRAQRQRPLSAQRQVSPKLTAQRQLGSQRKMAQPQQQWQQQQWQQQQQQQRKPQSQLAGPQRKMAQPQQQQWQKPQQRKQQQRQPVLSKMPQKYRIAIDCNVLRPKTIRTDVKDVQGKRCLVVCAKTREGRDFRRQFALPKDCQHQKQLSYFKPSNIFVCEFPVLEAPMISRVDIRPEIVRQGREQFVTLNLTIPETVDPAKVEVCVKDRDLIIRLEDKPISSIGSKCASKVFFYNRIMLPEHTDVSLLKCVQKKRKLIIKAPLLKVAMGGYHCVPIHRKLRHKKTKKAVTAAKTQKQAVTPSIGKIQKQKVPSGITGLQGGVGVSKVKKPAVPTLKSTVIGGEKKKTEEKKKPTTSGIGIGISGIGKKVSGQTQQLKGSSETKSKQVTSTQAPLTKKKSKSKLIGGEQQQQQKTTSPTSTSPLSKSGKSGSLSRGSEVLQQIFGSSSGRSSEEQSSGRKSSNPTINL